MCAHYEVNKSYHKDHSQNVQNTAWLSVLVESPKNGTQKQLKLLESSGLV